MPTFSQAQLLFKRISIRNYIALMKPRVMSLSIFTALTGMILAPGWLSIPRMLGILTAISMGASACGVLNMWYERLLDAKMERTQRRPIPQGLVLPQDALIFGLVLLVASLVLMASVSNIVATALLAFTVFFYVVIYTMWLKPLTSQNIVIGGLAGALPPLVGWASIAGNISLMPLLMLAIIFLWTPAHFWALALSYTREYRKAGLPMLPVVVGEKITCRYIFAYSLLTLGASLLPWILGYVGILYGACALISGGIFVLLAGRMLQQGQKYGRELFGYSIIYLLILFLMMILDHGIYKHLGLLAA
jgi:protoheme IX farnesyltransferase